MSDLNSKLNQIIDNPSKPLPENNITAVVTGGRPRKYRPKVYFAFQPLAKDVEESERADAIHIYEFNYIASLKDKARQAQAVQKENAPIEIQCEDRQRSREPIPDVRRQHPRP